MNLEQNDPRFNEFQMLKRKFFALRNGILAERLRASGDMHRIIFGLTLAQVMDIARSMTPSTELAEKLWANDTTRESRLLAPMIWPCEDVSPEKALKIASEVMSTEEADVLCHRWLRKMPFAPELIDRIYASEDDLQRYIALRLALNLINTAREKAKRLAEIEKDAHTPYLKSLAIQILDEIDWMEQ